LKSNNNSKSNLNENRYNDDISVDEILDIRKNVNDYYNSRLNEPRGGNNLEYSRNAERGLSPDSKRSHNSNLNFSNNTNNKVKQEKSLNNNKKESNKKQEKFNKSIGK